MCRRTNGLCPGKCVLLVAKIQCCKMRLMRWSLGRRALFVDGCCGFFVGSKPRNGISRLSSGLHNANSANIERRYDHIKPICARLVTRYVCSMTRWHHNDTLTLHIYLFSMYNLCVWVSSSLPENRWTVQTVRVVTGGCSFSVSHVFA